jgi:hypothetical protein
MLIENVIERFELLFSEHFSEPNWLPQCNRKGLMVLAYFFHLLTCKRLFNDVCNIWQLFGRVKQFDFLLSYLVTKRNMFGILFDESES